MAFTLRMTEEEFAAMQAKRAPKKRNKYGNVRTGGFDSKREAKVYAELKARLKAGEIQALGRQVEFCLPGGIIYRADFVYFQAGLHVVDAKGVRTDAYKLKRRLMASLGFTIEEV